MRCTSAASATTGCEHGGPLCFFGGLPAQFGYCNGVNTRLACCEYHQCSELLVAADDLVLVVGPRGGDARVHAAHETEVVGQRDDAHAAGVVAQGLRRFVRAAVVDDDEPIAELLGLVHVVRRENEGRTALLEAE